MQKTLLVPLRRVSDLPLLGRTTIEEAVALLNWMTDADLFRTFVLAGMYLLRLSFPLIVCPSNGPFHCTGNSMGGLHSAMTACLYPEEVGVVSWLGPPSAASVFTRVSKTLTQFC